MDHETSGGWVYIMTDRYGDTLYVGVTADLALKVSQHREGTGADFCARHGLKRLVWAERFDSIVDAIANEKRLKRWHRAGRSSWSKRPTRSGMICSILWSECRESSGTPGQARGDEVENGAAISAVIRCGRMVSRSSIAQRVSAETSTLPASSTN